MLLEMYITQNKKKGGTHTLHAQFVFCVRVLLMKTRVERGLYVCTPKSVY